MKKLIALIVSLCMLVSMLPAVAETPAETKKVDMNMLIYKLLFDIQGAVVRVDMEDLKARSTATPGASDGNVFAVLKKVLTDAAEAMDKEGKKIEDMDKLLAYIEDPEITKNADEKEYELLSSLAILAMIENAKEDAAAQEAAEDLMTVAIANNILKRVFAACKENEALNAAVKATGSKLFEMLDKSNTYIKEHVEKVGEVEVVTIEVDEKPYEDFEAEIKKLEDYLNASEGQKQSALDLLSLLHTVIDDVHEAIDGHSHEQANAVDHYKLVGEMLKDLGEAVSKVNLDEIKEKGGDKFNTTGSVYAVLEKVVNSILADEDARKKEAKEELKKILETVSKLAEKDMTEKEAEAVFDLILVGLAAEATTGDQVDPEAEFLRSTHILKATLDTLLENDVAKTALEATGSTLPQMLENFGQMLAAYVKENGTLHEMKDLPEGPFIAIETEFAKLREYIEGLEDGTPGKAKALGVLNLLHEYVDDVHQAIDGHAHQEPAK